jgi:putative endonuclease
VGVNQNIMWYVYILRSARDNKLYIGSTDDISHRLLQHNSGEVDSTKNRMPLILEAYLAVKDKVKAIELEQYFKTGSGSAILNKRIL